MLDEALKNFVSCSLKIPPLKLSPGMWYPRVSGMVWCLGEYWRCARTQRYFSNAFTRKGLALTHLPKCPLRRDSVALRCMVNAPKMVFIARAATHGSSGTQLVPKAGKFNWKLLLTHLWLQYDPMCSIPFVQGISRYFKLQGVQLQ